MSRQKIIVIIVLVTFVATGLAYVFTGPAKRPQVDARPAGASLGSEVDASAALWLRMSRLKSWLPTFEEAFTNPEPEAKTVLAAFAALAEKVGGPAGFWRDTVPNELLACHKDPDQAVCRRLNESLPELTDGESLARSIGRLDETRAQLFLSRNADAMLQWVQMFAPSEPTAAAMRLTSFWEQKLAPAVAGQQ